MSKPAATVLSGGGARGAYQAGAIRGLYEICASLNDFSVFQTICGVSAGSINAYHLAAGIGNLDQTTLSLCDLWTGLTADQVFRTDYASITRNAFKLVRTISLSQFQKSESPRRVGLLNTDPLRDLIGSGGGPRKIEANLNSGELNALVVTATDYSTSFSVSFIQSKKPYQDWVSDNRLSQSVQITDDHIMASSSIPVFFPPIEVGERFYGDGSLRNSAPLSPAIHLGAEKIFVIGVRNWANVTLETAKKLNPSLGRVISVLINSIFLDSIESDLERVELINQSILNLQGSGIEQHLKPIETFYIHPSKNLAELAQERSEDLPKIIKYLFDGLGTNEESAELLSYFLFDSDYCSQLVELGHKDTMDQKARIQEFLKR